MGDCSKAACSGDDGPLFTCKYCNRKFCSDHRLPENHDCPGLAYSERQGKHLEAWHDTLEDDSSTGILSKAKRTVLGSSESERKDDSSDETPDSERSTEPDEGQAPEADEREARDSAQSNDTPGNISGSPQSSDRGGVNPYRSDTRSTAEKSSGGGIPTPGDSDKHGQNSQQSGTVTAAIMSLRSHLKTVEQHFVNLPWYALAAVRRYGPTLMFLGVVAVVGLAVTGHQLPVDVAGLLPAGASEQPVAAGPAITTTAAISGAPTATQTNSDDGQPTTAVRMAGVTADGELNETWLEHRVHHYVNEERQQRSLNALDWHQTIHDAADYHSRQMIQDDFFAHEHPGTGSTFEDRYYRVGYECRVPTSGNQYATGGENIAYTYYEERIRLDNGSTVEYNTPDEVAAGLVRSWMNSEGHRENILRDYWRQEGIGIEITETTEGTRVYATQNFC